MAEQETFSHSHLVTKATVVLVNNDSPQEDIPMLHYTEQEDPSVGRHKWSKNLDLPLPTDMQSSSFCVSDNIKSAENIEPDEIESVPEVVRRLEVTFPSKKESELVETLETVTFPAVTESNPVILNVTTEDNTSSFPMEMDSVLVTNRGETACIKMESAHIVKPTCVPKMESAPLFKHGEPLCTAEKELASVVEPVDTTCPETMEAVAVIPEIVKSAILKKESASVIPELPEVVMHVDALPASLEPGTECLVVFLRKHSADWYETTYNTFGRNTLIYARLSALSRRQGHPRTIRPILVIPELKPEIVKDVTRDEALDEVSLPDDDIAVLPIREDTMISNWSDEQEAGGLPRNESMSSRMTNAVRQLLCCGVPYSPPSEDNVSTTRFGSGV